MSDATHFSAGCAYNVAFCGPFAAKLTPGKPARGYNGTDRENSRYVVVSLQSITHKSPSEVCARRRLFLLASPPLNGRRASSSCLAVAGRLGARSPLTVPAPAALPWLRGVALDLPPYQLVGAPRART